MMTNMPLSTMWHQTILWQRGEMDYNRVHGRQHSTPSNTLTSARVRLACRCCPGQVQLVAAYAAELRTARRRDLYAKFLSEIRGDEDRQQALEQAKRHMPGDVVSILNKVSVVFCPLALSLRGCTWSRGQARVSVQVCTLGTLGGIRWSLSISRGYVTERSSLCYREWW